MYCAFSRLDLRIGAAFTRMQSKALWGQVAQCNEKLVSYGMHLVSIRITSKG